MTKIEWTDETWNPVTGCTKVSAGCANCYAERMARRLAGRYGYPEAPHHFDVTVHKNRLWHPPIGRKPRRIFVCSMSDIAHPDVRDAIIDQCTRHMAFSCPEHQWLVLTKRPSRLRKLWADRDPIPNLWVGVTVENRDTVWRIDELMRIPAAVRFVSFEPLLDDVAVALEPGHEGIDWAIAGGESGPGARPMHPDWARSLRDQAQAAGVPFFFKQWGAWSSESVAGLWSGIDSPPTNIELVDGGGSAQNYQWMARVGKKAAGRLLDGREWNEMPC